MVSGIRVGDLESDNWLEISSIQYLNGGTSNGAFKKYGKDNIVHALETIKRNTKYTGEKVLMNSVLLSLASVYQSFTTDQSLFGIKPSEKEDYESSKSKKNYKPPFLVKELNKFFDDHIKWSCSDDNPYKNEEAFKFSNMAMTGKVKNMEFIFLNLLYSKLVSNHKKIRGNTKNMLSHGKNFPDTQFHWVDDHNNENKLQIKNVKGINYKTLDKVCQGLV